MSRTDLIFILLILFGSCQNTIHDDNKKTTIGNKDFPKVDSTSKKSETIIYENVSEVFSVYSDSICRINEVKYKSIMKKKNISLFVASECKNANASEINKYKSLNCLIDSSEILSNSISVNFKFVGICCEKFMGDYKIKNDTLIFELEKVNDEACSCYCWYRYKLKIDKLKLKVKQVIVRHKNSG